MIISFMKFDNIIIKKSKMGNWFSSVWDRLFGQ